MRDTQDGQDLQTLWCTAPCTPRSRSGIQQEVGAACTMGIGSPLIFPVFAQGSHSDSHRMWKPGPRALGPHTASTEKSISRKVPRSSQVDLWQCLRPNPGDHGCRAQLQTLCVTALPHSSLSCRAASGPQCSELSRPLCLGGSPVSAGSHGLHLPEAGL